MIAILENEDVQCAVLRKSDQAYTAWSPVTLSVDNNKVHTYMQVH